MIKGVRTILVNTTAVTDLVGTSIFPERVPQEQGYPAVVLNTSSTRPGISKQRQTSLFGVALQVLIYTQTYAQAEAIANAIRVALDNYTGTSNGEVFQRIVFEDEGVESQIELEIIAFSQRYSVWEIK